MKSNSSRCSASFVYITTALLVAPAAYPLAQVYVTPQDNGIPYFSDAPLGKASQLIHSRSASLPLRSKLAAVAMPPAWHWYSVVKDVAARHGVDPALVQAVIEVESHFDPSALSRKGAVGMMQLMPQTSARYGVQDAFDAYQNIDAGVRHLRMLLDAYHGNVPLALAAYNAGEHSITAHQGLIPPYRETMLYVPKVLARYEAYRTSTLARESSR